MLQLRGTFSEPAVILVIDNYDSFTYNLVQYLGILGAEVNVRRNDEIDLDGIAALQPAGIMLSPGPCTPAESGICLDILRAATSEDSRLAGIPIFGVCLGHQAMGEVGGGKVTQAKRIMHGKASPVEHDGQGLFAGMPNPFTAIRYHSLVITEATVPAEYVITARSQDDREVMGIRHRSLPIEGVQFHPESILTEKGIRIVENFVRWAGLPIVAGATP